ncbi:peptide deformylase, mitochondrial-like [Plodia interpunctella]|uniref:peptide deformylase, mitochondrial-like n=1 Tax=Plodia interpunctella TaxID=58824 RepID=UPI0023685E7B|nr:peptide deformylase, mitochondrial-like [Plodia interpunctella]
MGVTRKILNWYARIGPSHGKKLPPYEHVVQIGDPMLRKASEPVAVDKIKSEEIQKLIKKLKYVLDKYGSVGMSAPQIGVNKRIFVMRQTALQIASIPKESVKTRGITVVPFSVFINPTLKVIDYSKVTLSEGCESVQGYTAEVARYKEVEITALNAEGDSTSTKYKDWAARIAQHEMEHLDGKLYTDIMDRKSLQCIFWEEVNLAKGKLAIPFYPD